MEKSGAKDLCPFCKAPPPRSNEEKVERTEKLMEKGNADALYMLGGYYFEGCYGLPQDWAKANEFYLKAGQLGCVNAYYNLGNSYFVGRGMEADKKKATHYYELAAMNGDVAAMHNLGMMEGRAGNYKRAFKQIVLAARAGFKVSLESVMDTLQKRNTQIKMK